MHSLVEMSLLWETWLPYPQNLSFIDDKHRFLKWVTDKEAELLLLLRSISQICVMFLFDNMAPHNGEGNGNPLQYSGLENPMDGGAW